MDCNRSGENIINYDKLPCCVYMITPVLWGLRLLTPRTKELPSSPHSCPVSAMICIMFMTGMCVIVVLTLMLTL